MFIYFFNLHAWVFVCIYIDQYNVKAAVILKQTKYLIKNSMKIQNTY